jgi:very-short-patch-repair endonuclease
MAAGQHKCLPPSLLITAEEQDDLLELAELLAAGLSRHAITRLVQRGVLHRLHRGVYKVGTPTPSADGRRRAAAYAAGPGSVVSHLDAGELNGLALKGSRYTVHVTTKRGRRPQRGITMHQVRRLDPADITTTRGIRVTRIARTLIDLADVLSPAELRRVIHEAEVSRLLNVPAIDAAMSRVSGRNLRAIKAAIAGHRPRSDREIEQRLARIAHAAGLRGGLPNFRTVVDGQEFERDLYFPHLRLCLEADGYAVHKTRQKLNSDRRNDRILTIRLGITTLRYTWDDVTIREPETRAQLATYAERQDLAV